jgi:hypothetical protein
LHAAAAKKSIWQLLQLQVQHLLLHGCHCPQRVRHILRRGLLQHASQSIEHLLQLLF